MSSMAPVALSTAKVSTVGRHVLSAGHCCPDRTVLSCFHIYRGVRGLLHSLHVVSGREKAVGLRFTEVEERLWQKEDSVRLHYRSCAFSTSAAG